MADDFAYDARTIDNDVRGTLAVARRRGAALTYRQNNVLLFVATGRGADLVYRAVKGISELVTKVDGTLVVANVEADQPHVVGDYTSTFEDTVLYTQPDGRPGQAPYDCVVVLPRWEARSIGWV